MKRLIFGGLSAVLLATAIVPAANAQDQQDNQPTGPQEIFGLPGSERQQGVSDVDAGNTDMNRPMGQDESMQEMTPSQEFNQNDSTSGDRTSSEFTAQPNVAIDLSPFQVVSLARQGAFNNQGIPGYFNLSQQFQSRQVDGEDLVQAAIDRYGFSAELLNDEGYVLAVERQLQFRDNYNSYF